MRRSGGENRLASCIRRRLFGEKTEALFAECNICRDVTSKVFLFHDLSIFAPVPSFISCSGFRDSLLVKLRNTATNRARMRVHERASDRSIDGSFDRRLEIAKRDFYRRRLGAKVSRVVELTDKYILINTKYNVLNTERRDRRFPRFCANRSQLQQRDTITRTHDCRNANTPWSSFAGERVSSNFQRRWDATLLQLSNAYKSHDRMCPCLGVRYTIDRILRRGGIVLSSQLHAK